MGLVKWQMSGHWRGRARLCLLYLPASSSMIARSHGPRFSASSVRTWREVSRSDPALCGYLKLTATPELNKTYLGKIQRITDFGAFVEIMPGTDGLLHVSEIANHRVKDVRDELKEGEQILVKVINIDPTGKIRLSRKALLQEAPTPPAAG